jgi:hypothetical protein
VEQNYSKKRVGEGDVRLDDERLSRALHEEKKRKAARGEEDDDRLGKKRKNAGGSHDVTEEELGKISFLLHFFSTMLNDVDRGVSNESSHDGRSDGKLCGQGVDLLNEIFVFVVWLYVSVMFSEPFRKDEI